MKTYQEMVREYQKRQRDTVVDTIATGLTYMDEIAVETGVLEETGLLTELTEAACGALPFVMIAATEGTKVVLGKKTGKSGMKDGAFRHGEDRRCHEHRRRSHGGGGLLGGAACDHGRAGHVRPLSLQGADQSSGAGAH